MCGIVGYLQTQTKKGTRSDLIEVMTRSLDHRGPDSFDTFQEGPIALGHARLAIVDVSPTGAQPMQSACGRFVLTYNGEIYNHDVLRREIEGLDYFRQQIGSWRGTSDSEVLLAAIGCWGLIEALKKCVGMFALALWDRQEKATYLVRDRAGEKPLYYGQQNGVFLFASELKALKKHPDFKPDIDRNSLALFLRHNYIPTPYSIYQSVFKAKPGFVHRITSDGEITERPYWSFQDVISRPKIDVSDLEAVDGLEALLHQAVGEQMVADVPLGAFLSGGIDSSTIVALMQAQSQQRVKTFSIGFHEGGYNEAVNAKKVAQHIGTDHTELYVESKDALDIIPQLPSMYDEPFSDSSQIPTHLVAKLAREHVTVSLSGDAGDELFCGYSRYSTTQNYWSKLSKFSPRLRYFLSQLITTIPVGALNTLGRAVPSARFGARFGDKLHKGADVLASEHIDGVYRGLTSHWNEPEAIVIDGMEYPTAVAGNRPDFDMLEPIEQFMALDFLTYLEGDILTKVDRAAMSVSLETRVPMLDHRVIEYAWSLPLSQKYHQNQGKWILRQVLKKYVPDKLTNRPKMGFGIPIDSWLRGPLRDWAEALLDENRLSKAGYFNPGPIRKKWEEHLSGKRNWSYHLWDILMFEAWLDEQKSS